MPAEGFEFGMKDGPPALPAIHQGFGVIAQELLGDTPEVAKGSLQPHDPVPLPQAAEDLGLAASGPKFHME